VQISSSASLF